MKNIVFIISLFAFGFANAQSLPIDFESTITTSDFVDFDGGIATVIDNPQSSGINTSAKVAQIVRDGGEVWAGSKIELANNLDFSSLSKITMKVFTTAPIGTNVKFKLEGAAATERDVVTTVTNEWETLTWDFTGEPMDYNFVVFMFDFGNTGNGSINSTFLFDDVEQFFAGTQIDWPVGFEDSDVDYTMTDFGGNVSSLVEDPTDSNNTVIQAIKTDQAAAWAGTTIGTPSGFATNLPLTLSDSKMTVRVWSPEAGTPIRLKVEKSSDPTQTCETEVNTTVAGWETMEFDFVNEAPGTQTLEIGLGMGWTYNQANIFFNFGTEGSAAGEQTYYFDDVKFGGLDVGVDEPIIEDLKVFPNPTISEWNITTEYSKISEIELFDLQGKLLLRKQAVDKVVKIDASLLNDGIYICKISANSGTKTIRLAKN